MRLRDYLFAILLVVLAGCVGCNQEEDYNWGDPISIPDHPAFIANFGPETNTITVLDLDKEEIVGRRRVLPERTDADDFAVWGTKELFFCIDYAEFDTELGEEITIIDPSIKEQKVGSIKTYPSPAGIFPIDAKKALVVHTFRSYSDSLWTTTLIDIEQRKVLREFHLQSPLEGIVEFSDGRVYIFYSGWGGSSKMFMREFFTSSDSINSEVQLGELDWAPHSLVVIDDSLACAFGDPSEEEATYKSIKVIRLPTGSVEATIPLTEVTLDGNMTYVNNKLYVCHNTGNFMEHGNLDKVSVIDLEARSVIKVLDVCNGYPPGDIAYSKATNKILVVSYLGTIITIIDPDTDSIIKTIVSDEQGEEDWLGYDRLRIPE